MAPPPMAPPPPSAAPGPSPAPVPGDGEVSDAPDETPTTVTSEIDLERGDPAKLHRTELTRTYPCNNCGGELEFDIAAQDLGCAHCGNHVPIDVDGVPRPQEQDLDAAIAAVRSGAVERMQTSADEHEVVCQNCGGHTTFTGSLTATRCPYCATPIQRDDVHQAPARLPVDGQPGRGLVDVITLDRGGAVGAARRGQRPGERGVPAAVLAHDLVLVGRGLHAFHRTAADGRDRRVEVLLLRTRDTVDVDGHVVAAVRTAEVLGRDVELELATAVVARVGPGQLGAVELRRVTAFEVDLGRDRRRGLVRRVADLAVTRDRRGRRSRRRGRRWRCHRRRCHRRPFLMPGTRARVCVARLARSALRTRRARDQRPPAAVLPKLAVRLAAPTTLHEAAVPLRRHAHRQAAKPVASAGLPLADLRPSAWSLRGDGKTAERLRWRRRLRPRRRPRRPRRLPGR